MASPVTIRVKDDSSIPVGVYGVGVWVLDLATYAVITQGSTDVTGAVGFMLEDGTYEVRFFMRGYGFPNPNRLVVDHTLTNTFPVTARNLMVLTPSMDSRCCRCTGKFVDFQNNPMVGVTVLVHAQDDLGLKGPKVVDGNMVAPDIMSRTTDSNGTISFDLLRGGSFWVTFAGEEDTARQFTVPNRDSVNLIDLIHPTPVGFVWDPTTAPGNAVSVPNGHTVTIPVTVTFSDFLDRSTEIMLWIQYMTDPTQTFALVSYNPSTGSLTLQGLSPGTFTVTPQRADGQPVRVPNPLAGAPVLTVTVTP